MVADDGIRRKVPSFEKPFAALRRSWRVVSCLNT
jgi:hypothetical protein